MKKPHLQARGDFWQKQRMRALVRDDFQCQYHQLGLTPIESGCCKETPENRLRCLQVHHIKGRTHFLPHQLEGHDLSNLVTICLVHHEQIHPHMRYERYRATDKGLNYDVPDRIW